MRVRVPHGSEDKRLRFHGLRAQVKRREHRSELPTVSSKAMHALTLYTSSMLLPRSIG
jgi:hypothetical protein